MKNLEKAIKEYHDCVVNPRNGYKEIIQRRKEIKREYNLNVEEFFRTYHSYVKTIADEYGYQMIRRELKDEK